ncbi:glycosyltransferase family 8 protein [Fructilactobacillus fructivorans]|uniref:Glycosyl transferase, family 8 n=1 Tax=Fructilactobacillus fructivorans TaxID=1614 RepID=A0A0C1LZR2_9LACO|nr:glycosyltransferase family 8 protein [Fructilactobacillus fructivorans]KID42365.1 glycosyl transferase, family 8 [Fructilactobacillus fructivorans]MCT0151018.1 glycosyltransferase family 8 protein [Fructilactobacillus fructivorans]MCT2867424.1 glycosyltransferase family 8 protein [Fructilactobacillus fructivorans]MCT2869057.1 glycosyltransferase family 8 protein [Fructilactobacillus fructivorans]MCT2873223.1 glycosyltransferase family 8 protein [Fructilactobacillus fructivorans]
MKKLNGVGDPITIASTTDNNMAIPLVINYTSLLCNNPHTDFEFFVVNDHLKRSNKNLMMSLQRIFENCRLVKFLDPHEERYQQANTDAPNSVIKRNTYYRIDIPEEIKRPRILYLDADMICDGDITGLWQADLGGKVIGAVENAGYLDRLREMGVSEKPGRYFNAGLLLIDTKKWKEQGISQRARNLANDHPEILRFQDQDALNAIFNGDWQSLPSKYNVQSNLVKGKYRKSGTESGRRSQQEALEQPVIIHYTNFDKPWLIRNDHLHPLRSLYDEYQNKLLNQLAHYVN